MRPSRGQLLALLGPAALAVAVFVVWAVADRVYLRLKDHARP